ncbi:unnamed protein product [Leuciscus chuanchicus]
MLCVLTRTAARTALVKPCRLPTPVSVVQISDRTLVHQESLPKLPVPPLKQTFARYMASLEPLISEEEMAHTQQLMKEFLQPGGVGERLQKSLERRARKTENWLSDWWMQSAYLDSRMPVAMYTSPGVVLPKMHFQDRQGQIRATLSDGDRHVVCVSCLGEEHAALALADGGCPHCELMAMATLRTRLAVFTETAPPPAAASRCKKRRAQRAPEPSLSRQSSPVRPLASPASSVSLPDGQRPPSAAASVDIADEEALLGEDDSCSILASGSEDWAGSEDPAPPARTSSAKRASIETELMRVLAQAAASLGLEWSSPEQPAHNRLDGFFLPGERASPASRPAPFLPELHEEVAKSWNAPYSARVRPAVSLAFSAVDDAKNKGYLSLPPVEEAIAAHLCPPSAGRRAKPALPSKACRTTSSLLRRAFSAAGQAASALHTMATLQIFQADLLRKLDEEGPDAICVPDLRSATDLALRATKSAAQAIGRTMASLTVSERHLWLTLSEMAESERTAFLDAPLSATGLFGSSVKDFAERFAEIQKASQAMKHFLPKRSSSAAGRAKPSAQSSQPQPPSTASSSQRRQPRSARPRSRSSGRRPAGRGPRPRITVKPEAPKSS